MNEAIQCVLNLPTLAPCPEVNAAFSRLVEAVITASHIPRESLPHLPRLQARCAEAEGELEQYWSRSIAAASDPRAELATFPYWGNYRELTRRELQLLAGTGKRLPPEGKVAFVGSGPLPLTAWWLYVSTGAALTLVDICPEAIALSRQLAAALQWPCTHIQADGRTLTFPTASLDVVYVAGLAGASVEDKQQIVDALLPSLRPDGRLVIRSAAGARAALYPEFPAAAIRGVELMAEYHPADDVINSVFIYRT